MDIKPTMVKKVKNFQGFATSYVVATVQDQKCVQESIFEDICGIKSAGIINLILFWLCGAMLIHEPISLVFGAKLQCV